jgi:hypothetical protein
VEHHKKKGSRQSKYTIAAPASCDKRFWVWNIKQFKLGVFRWYIIKDIFQHSRRQSLHRQITRLFGQPEGKNISATSSSISTTVACYARGLAVTHSRKLSATLGGSTSTRPGVRKITLKTYDFIDISNTMIPTTLRGSTTTLPPIVVVILRQ